jgi:hypothetical protein
MNTLEFLTWVATSSPGARVEYWSGLLAVDRTKDGRKRSFHEAQEIAQLAHSALKAAERGDVHLVQRRNGHGCIYIAERRYNPPPKAQQIRQLSLAGVSRHEIGRRLKCSGTIVKMVLEEA